MRGPHIYTLIQTNTHVHSLHYVTHRHSHEDRDTQTQYERDLLEGKVSNQYAKKLLLITRELFPRKPIKRSFRATQTPTKYQATLV